MITLTTIGYGDISPTNQLEMVYVTISVPITCILFGYVISSIQSIFSTMKQSSDRYNHAMGIVNRYIKLHRLPPQLQMRVRNYFDCYLRNVHNESEEAAQLMD